jgi:hypothetical protein
MGRESEAGRGGMALKAHTTMRLNRYSAKLTEGLNGWLLKTDNEDLALRTARSLGRDLGHEGHAKLRHLGRSQKD